MGLEKNSQECTAFSKSMGLFHFTMMPFDLVNSPSTFSRLMGSLFSDLQWVELLAYMDDILSTSDSFEEGIERLGRIFDQLLMANLCLKHERVYSSRRAPIFLDTLSRPRGQKLIPKRFQLSSIGPHARQQNNVPVSLALPHIIGGFALVLRKLPELSISCVR